MGWRSWFKSRCLDERRRIVELEFDVARLEGEIDVIAGRFDDCSADRSLLLSDLNQAARDIVYLEEQHHKYGKIIASTLTPPRFKTYTVSRVVYNPWEDVVKPSVVRSVVDRKYLCFTETEWRKQLAATLKVYKEPMGRWDAEFGDCDDFASMAFALHRFGCEKAGLPYSGCFGWARSRGHAFNVYRVKTGEWMVWEPQNGATVGRLGEVAEPYVVTEVRI